MVAIRSAVLTGYVELAAELGLNPHLLLRSAGIDPRSLESADVRLDAAAVDLLLERSAGESGRPDFGVRLAGRRGISTLGPIALAAREEPDVRSAIRLITRYLTVHTPAVRATLDESGPDVVRLSAAGIEFGRQAVETTVTAATQVLRSFLGPEWMPAAVLFTHAAPPTPEPEIARVLGERIEYGREVNGVVCHPGDLDATNPLADAGLQPYARRYLESLAPADYEEIVDRVHSLVSALLPTGRCTADHVARSLGMDRKTLYRRLTAAGRTYSDVVDTVRTDGAQRYLRTEPGRSLTEIATELGFSELSAFSRWFSGRFGASPTAWLRAGADIRTGPGA